MSIFEHTWLSLSIHVFTWLYLILHNYIMYWRDDHQCIFHRGYMFGFPSTDTMDDLGPINPSCWANSLIKTGMDSGTIVENAKTNIMGMWWDIQWYTYIYIYICPYLSKHHGLITVFHVIFDKLSTQLAGVCHALESQLGIRLDVSN